MKDQYANYVVQKMLTTCNEQHKEILLSRVKIHLPLLKKYTYAKHIVSLVERLCGDGESSACHSSSPAKFLLLILYFNWPQNLLLPYMPFFRSCAVRIQKNCNQGLLNSPQESRLFSANPVKFSVEGLSVAKVANKATKKKKLSTCHHRSSSYRYSRSKRFVRVFKLGNDSVIL